MIEDLKEKRHDRGREYILDLLELIAVLLYYILEELKKGGA